MLMPRAITVAVHEQFVVGQQGRVSYAHLVNMQDALQDVLDIES